MTGLPDLCHRFQRPSPRLPQPEHEPAERRHAGAVHGRGVRTGAAARPHQHARQLGNRARAHAKHARVSRTTVTI